MLLSFSIKQPTWSVALRGVFAIIFGVFALLYPHDTLSFIIILFGLYIVINGILAIIFSIYGCQYHEPDWWFYLIEGIASTIIGIVIFFLPIITGIFLIYIISIWAILTGIIQLFAYIRLEKMREHQILLFISGLLSILLGIVFFCFPIGSIIMITWVMGLYALLFGLITLITAFNRH